MKNNTTRKWKNFEIININQGSSSHLGDKFVLQKSIILKKKRKMAY